MQSPQHHEEIMDPKRKVPTRKDSRIIIHFDYDCFYASVFEVARPELKSLPLGIQQKQIIVTCNYEARRRGLHKLQLITDAKRICPDVVIELGEDISRFRDASKELYGFIKGFSWNHKVERLGFDEVFMDVSDIVEYNQELLNRNDLSHSFFQTSREDPTAGFEFNATGIAGHTYPKDYVYDSSAEEVDSLTLRLRLGSHLALHIRHQMEEQKGYTCTVGIATDKLLSKLAGNLNKPKGQTTVMPPLVDHEDRQGNVTTFIDGHDIGKIPGIGFKLALKLRDFFLKRPADFDRGLVYGGTKEKVTVKDIRTHPDVNPEMLERLLGGPGSPHGIGEKVWCLLHGVDDTEVSEARAVPRQISQEDSYIRLDTMPELVKELTMLAGSLITRMRIDLLGSDDEFEDPDGEDKPVSANLSGKKWLAHPKTLRLTTRPRQPLQPDGTRIRSFKRISHSGPLPNFVFNLTERVDVLAEKLVKESLLGMFRKLHPEKAGWNLSLVNLAVTNMAETAGDSKSASGRDIKGMFSRQEDVLKDFRVVESGGSMEKDETVLDDPLTPVMQNAVPEAGEDGDGNEDDEEETGWDDGEGDENPLDRCGICGLCLPPFAMDAHARFHIQ